MSYFKKLLFVSIFVITALAGAQYANAGNSELSGWAWSSGIGWISFNSKDAGAGGGPYSVTLATTTNSDVGTLGGWAWSSSIGWIRFGGLSDFPVSSSSANATINMTTGAISGMARACAGTINAADPDEPGDCSTMTSRTDGWDGWISLSGTNHASPNTNAADGTSEQGVTLGVNPLKPEAYGKLTGFAWGGEVVGWVSFKPLLGIGVRVPNIICENPPCDGSSGDPAFNVSGEDGVIVQREVGASGDAGIIVSGGISGNQTIEITLGSFTPPNGISVTLREANGNLATGGKVTCVITPSLPSCTAKVRLSISDSTQITTINQVSVPVVGTRINPTLSSNNVLTDNASFIIPNADSGGDLSLWAVKVLAGGSGYGTTKFASVTIKEGGTANLAWVTTGMDDDSCRGVNIGPNDSTILNTWKGVQPESKNGDTPFQITGLTKGEYNLRLRCEIDGNQVYTEPPVLIKVIKLNESEF